MGRIVAQLHGSSIRVDDVESPPLVDRDRLVELVQAGGDAAWASRLGEALEEVLVIAGRLRRQ